MVACRRPRQNRENTEKGVKISQIFPGLVSSLHLEPSETDTESGNFKAVLPAEATDAESSGEHLRHNQNVTDFIDFIKKSKSKMRQRKQGSKFLGKSPQNEKSRRALHFYSVQVDQTYSKIQTGRVIDLEI